MRRILPPLSLHAWLRFDAIERLLPDGARTLLEIGAGQGSAGLLLARRYTYVGLEPDEQSFATATTRIGGIGTVLKTTAETYEPDAPFDVVCALEVLEHIEDDRGALLGWKRHVRTGGWLLISVPAGRGRYGPTDVKAGHYRRYDRDDLAAVLAAAGFTELAIVAYGFPLGYALEAGRNLYAKRHVDETSPEERTAASGRWLQPTQSIAGVLHVASAPFRYAQRPFGRTHLGTGLVARARRPS